MSGEFFAGMGIGVAIGYGMRSAIPVRVPEKYVQGLRDGRKEGHDQAVEYLREALARVIAQKNITLDGLTERGASVEYHLGTILDEAEDIARQMKKEREESGASQKGDKLF